MGFLATMFGAGGGGAGAGAGLGTGIGTGVGTGTVLAAPEAAGGIGGIGGLGTGGIGAGTVLAPGATSGLGGLLGPASAISTPSFLSQLGSGLGNIGTSIGQEFSQFGKGFAEHPLKSTVNTASAGASGYKMLRDELHRPQVMAPANLQKPPPLQPISFTPRQPQNGGF